MELEELEAYLDPSFSPERWLDKEPSPPKKKLKLSLSYKKHRFTAPVTSDKLCDAAKGIVPDNTKKNNAWTILNLLGFFCCSLFNINHDNSQLLLFCCCILQISHDNCPSALFSLIGKIEHCCWKIEQWFCMQCSMAFRVTVFSLISLASTLQIYKFNVYGANK